MGDISFWGNGGYLIYLSTSGELNIYREGAQALATVDTGLDPMEEAVNLKVELKKDTINVYVNRSAVPALSVRDEASLEGSLCLTADWTDAEFDNVVIQGLKLSDEKEEPPVLDEAFTDDFETDTAAWRIVNSGDGAFERKEGQFLARGVSGANPVIAALRGRTYTDADISFDMTLPVMEAGWAGVSFGRSKWDDTIWNSGYFVYSGYSTKNKKTEIKLFKAGQGDVGSVMIDGEKGGTIRLRVKTLDKMISIYAFDGEEPVITWQDDAYTGGYLGLINYMTSNAFDNFTVKKAETDNPVLENVPYTDGFTKPEDWIILQPGNGLWEKTENGYTVKSTSSDYTQIALKNRVYSDAVVEFDMAQKHGGEDKWTYCSLRRTNENDGLWNSGYFLFYNQAKGWIKMYKTGTGEFCETSIGVSDGESRHFKIEMDGNTFKVYVDGSGTPAFTYVDDDNTYPKGYIALGTIDYAEMEISGFRVAKAEEGADPSEPGDPGEPTDPSEPGDPGEPGDPSEPGDPGEPTDPSGPGDPGEPADPSEPSDPGSPASPSDPGNPGNPEGAANSDDGADSSGSGQDSAAEDGRKSPATYDGSENKSGETSSALLVVTVVFVVSAAGVIICLKRCREEKNKN